MVTVTKLQLASPETLLLSETAVPTEVVLGNPSRDCQNFGICQIWALGERPEPNCGCGTVKAFLHRFDTASGGASGIALVFPKRNFLPGVAERHFGSGQFSVEKSYAVPEKIVGMVGFPAFIILPGEYPVLEEPDAFTVCF